MNESIHFLLICYNIFGGGFAWVLALGQFSLEYRSRNNYLLACYFILTGTWLILGSIVHLGGGDWFLFNIYLVVLPSFYGSLPLLFFYAQGIINHDYRISAGHILHFILPALSLIILLPFSMTRVNLYRVMNFFEHQNYRPDELLASAIMYSAILVGLFYLIWIIRDVKRLMNDASDSQNQSIRIVLYIARFLLVILLFWFVDRFFSLGWAQVTYAVVTSSLIASYLASSRYPELLLVVQLETENARYTKSQIENLDSTDVIVQIEQMMREDKAFLTDTITLKFLAEKVDITPHQLSELLNRKLNKSFNQMINEYRINEAKEILVQDPDRKILAVAYDVGFNSPSAFYKAFQKFAGVTPTRYRQAQST